VYLQGERILKLAEMCRRLETEEEKVLPFYASSLTDAENERVSEEMHEILGESLCEVSTVGGFPYYSLMFTGNDSKLTRFHSFLTVSICNSFVAYTV